MAKSAKTMARARLKFIWSAVTSGHRRCTSARLIPGSVLHHLLKAFCHRNRDFDLLSPEIIGKELYVSEQNRIDLSRSPDAIIESVGPRDSLRWRTGPFPIAIEHESVLAIRAARYPSSTERVTGPPPPARITRRRAARSSSLRRRRRNRSVFRSWMTRPWRAMKRCG